MGRVVPGPTPGVTVTTATVEGPVPLPPGLPPGPPPLGLLAPLLGPGPAGGKPVTVTMATDEDGPPPAPPPLLGPPLGPGAPPLLGGIGHNVLSETATQAPDPPRHEIVTAGGAAGEVVIGGTPPLPELAGPPGGAFPETVPLFPGPPLLGIGMMLGPGGTEVNCNELTGTVVTEMAVGVIEGPGPAPPPLLPVGPGAGGITPDVLGVTVTMTAVTVSVQVDFGEGPVLPPGPVGPLLEDARTVIVAKGPPPLPPAGTVTSVTVTRVSFPFCPVVPDPLSPGPVP